MHRPLRGLLLLLAAALLPCCLPPADDVGSGDTIAQVTVRASITIDKAEPNLPATRPSLSPDGMNVLFDSPSTSLVPSDGNGFFDIFMRRRVDGSVTNLTLINVPPSEFPLTAPHDCREAVLSANGRYIAFVSRGDYGGSGPDGAYSAPTTPLASFVIWRLDLQTGEFRRGFRSASAPNNHMGNPCISSTGRYVAFTTNATNLEIPLAALTPQQVFVTDLQNDVMTLVSRGTGGPLVPANQVCDDPSMSDDGQLIVFHSSATNLHADWAAGVRTHVYLGTSAGAAVQLVSRVSSPAATVGNNHSAFASLSANGDWIVFHTRATNLVGAGGPFIVRRSRVAGQNALVTDQPASTLFTGGFLDGYVSSISADGDLVAFLSRSDALAGQPLGTFANVFVRTMSSGAIVHASRHLDGRPSDEDCSVPVLSSDGRWVAWDTASANMVDGDTNGISDVFLRGPLR